MRESEYLGTPASKLISLHLAEAAMLAAAGGVIGLLLAWLGAKVLPLIAPANLPRLGDLAIHPIIVGFDIAVSAASALLFAAAPAWIQFRNDLAGALNAASTRLSYRATSRLQPALVITEFALALVLIAGFTWVPDGSLSALTVCVHFAVIVPHVMRTQQ